MLLLIVWFVVLNVNDYTFVTFQMVQSTLQTIAMHHCQEKVVHVLLFVIRFIVLDADDYFILVAFQIARSTLYVAWHTILSAGDCNVHV